QRDSKQVAPPPREANTWASSPIEVVCLMRAVIPWAKPDFWGAEQQYLDEAFRSTWISGGAFVERLEHDFATFCQVPHALAVANGTAALHLALLALGVHAGDE